MRRATSTSVSPILDIFSVYTAKIVFNSMTVTTLNNSDFTVVIVTVGLASGS